MILRYYLEEKNKLTVYSVYYKYYLLVDHWDENVLYFSCVQTCVQTT